MVLVQIVLINIVVLSRLLDAILNADHVTGKVDEHISLGFGT